ncbi:MAG: response regulator [Bdellovibrionales bacterium]|nr:response regulator [Bdellovibrionales bacterium]
MQRLVPFKNQWKNLSVSHKLYAVVGVMAVLIATELFTLLFAMNILSAVRAFVGGEGLWSKAQKDAVLEIQTYARTRDEKYYQAFREHLKVPLGDHAARLEMQKPNMDMAVVTQAFLEGQVHPQDIVPMVKLMRRFNEVSYLREAIFAWEKADQQIFAIIDASEQLHQLINQSGGRRASDEEVQALMDKILVINKEITEFENQFSSTLGEASRWLESTLMILLIIAVITVESTGLLLTITFSKGLTRVLNELNGFAKKVGSGDFSKKVPVRSNDELGHLAAALNKMTEELQEMHSERQIAERSNQIKSLFLANMSHEIRTPLNAILGFADLLKDTSLPRSESGKYLEIIERTGLGLLTIINDILDISKVEAGKLEIEKAPCSPQQIASDLEAMLRLRCEEKGITLNFEMIDLPKRIVTDQSRLKQILINIIGNAIKFTSQGGVKVTFRTEAQKLLCNIQDTGVGVPVESRHKLFQPFSQVDLSIRKKYGGSGLGLILSRRLANLMDGDVILKHSEPGRGSEFEVSIVFDADTTAEAPAKNRQTPTESSTNLHGKRILVVEDSTDNQLLAQQYLLKEGAEVVIANNGLEALQAMTVNTFDLVLMDMQMPVMDGYTATLELRDKGFKTPIIALTAHAMKEDLKRCLHSGCNDFLCKPFRRGDLLNMIAQYCQSNG